MHYCKYEDCLDGIKGYAYLEIEDKCVIRQISKICDRFIALNRNDSNPRYWHWLAEVDFNVNEFDNIILIDKAEFEEIWLENNKQYLTLWNKIKKNYSIGMKVKGAIEVFYPQGTIIAIDNGVLGIANYNECRNSTTQENIYRGLLVESIVKGYNEEDMWLILDNPIVHAKEY